MDIRSVWLDRVIKSIALSLAFALVSLGLSDAHAQKRSAADRSGGQGLKLAQYYYDPYYPYPQLRRKRVAPRRRAARRCSFPWTYSRGLRKCICVKDGYSISNGKCVKTAEICPKNAAWSQDENRCVCADGFVRNGSECTDPNAGTVTYNPAGDAQCLWPRQKSAEGAGCECASGYREDAGQCVRDTTPAQAEQRPAARPDELLTSDIATVQTCLKEAGYLRAAVSDTMNRPAWTAFWFFKQDYAVGRTPKGVHDAGAQHKLFALCPDAARALALRPANDKASARSVLSGTGQVPATHLAPRQKAALSPSAQTEIKPAPEIAAPARKVYARPEAGCLPDDLHNLIVRTYGDRAALKKCTRTCIPMPANITKREADAFEAKRGVRWCRSCIEIGAQLPLADILTIERGANVQVCSRPPSRLPKWVSPSVLKRPAYTKIRALYTQLPRSVENSRAVAVVIGNSNYAQGIPENSSAQASANAFYALLTEHLGFEQENIIDLRDAKLEDMRRVFGKANSTEGELQRRLRNSSDAKVFVYYAGHAGTRADASDSYLMPVDAVKYREDRSGYPMSQLYANLQSLGAKSVLVVLDAEFGRDKSDYVFPPNLPEMQVRALPVSPAQGISVLTASDADQKTLDDPQYGIGLFTRYLIEGLAGRADLAPIGNADREIDVVELYAYTSHMVRLAAAKSFGLLQKPILSHAGNARISRVQVQGQ